MSAVVERADAELLLDRYLDEWAAWMRGGTGLGVHVSAIAAVSLGADFADMCQAMDRRVAAITNALIDDLPPAQRMALHHRYLQAVYRFRDYPGTLAAARGAVATGLRRRGVWMGA